MKHVVPKILADKEQRKEEDENCKKCNDGHARRGGAAVLVVECLGLAHYKIHSVRNGTTEHFSIYENYLRFVANGTFTTRNPTTLLRAPWFTSWFTPSVGYRTPFACATV